MREATARLSAAAESIRASGRRVCTRTRTVSRSVCDAWETIEETVCDATETTSQTVCDAAETVSETVCDSWGSVPVIGGLFCASSHVVSTVVCTASHAVSTVVCTASHVVSSTVCVASHVVGATICIAWDIVTGIVYAILIAIAEFVGSFFDRAPEVRLIVEARRPLPVDEIKSMVNRHLGPGWRVEKAIELDPRDRGSRLDNFYRVTRRAVLTENPFDLCYRLRDAAGFVTVEPDPAYTGFLGGPIE